MPNCSYHVQGSVYKVDKEQFDKPLEAVSYAKSVLGTVKQIRPDGRIFTFYSASKEAKLLSRRKRK